MNYLKPKERYYTTFKNRDKMYSVGNVPNNWLKFMTEDSHWLMCLPPKIDLPEQ